MLVESNYPQRTALRLFFKGRVAQLCLLTAGSVALGFAATNTKIAAFVIVASVLSFAILAHPLYSISIVVALSGVSVTVIANRDVQAAGAALDDVLILVLVLGAFASAFLHGYIPVKPKTLFAVVAAVIVVLPPVVGVVDTTAGAKLILRAAAPLLVFLVVRYAPFDRENGELARVGLSTLAFGLAVSLVVTAALVIAGRGVLSLAEGGAPRFGGPLGAGLWSFFLLTPMCVALAAVAERATRGRLLILAAVTVGILATLTRSAILGSLAATAVATVGRQRIKRAFVLGALYACIAIALFQLVPSAVHRFRSGDGVSQSQVSGTFFGRQHLWNFIWETYVSPSPWTGSGLGATRSVFTGEAGFRTGAGAVHNDYLWILAETGILGLGAYLLALAAIAWTVVRTRADAVLRRAALGALLAFAIVSYFDNAIAAFAHFGVLVFGLAGLAARPGRRAAT
jgi:O-antigen ligase